MWDELLEEIGQERVRKRPGRRNLRCKKRGSSPFPAPPKNRSRSLPKTVGLIIGSVK